MTELNHKKFGLRHIFPLTVVSSPVNEKEYWAFNLSAVETHKMLLTYNDVSDIPTHVGVGSKPTKAARCLLSLLLEDDRERFDVW
jgi:hypothetical protein